MLTVQFGVNLKSVENSAPFDAWSPILVKRLKARLRENVVTLDLVDCSGKITVAARAFRPSLPPPSARRDSTGKSQANYRRFLRSGDRLRSSRRCRASDRDSRYKRDRYARNP